MTRGTRAIREMLPAFVLLAATAVAGPAESPQASAEAVIRGLQTDWNAADMSAYLDAYRRDDQLRLVFGKTSLTGWDTVNRVFREQYPDETRMGKFTIESLAVRLLGEDTAIASGTFEHIFPHETIRGAFTHVLTRDAGGAWKIEHEHTSRGETITHESSG